MEGSSNGPKVVDLNVATLGNGWKWQEYLHTIALLFFLYEDFQPQQVAVEQMIEQSTNDSTFEG
jgi:hypothetical protein